MFGVEGLTPEIFSVLAILCLTLTLFVVEIVRIDVVACLILVLLGITQLVPQAVLFSGFSSDAVISLIGVMIIGRGLEQTGVINRVTHWLLKFGKGKETRIRLFLMVIGGLMSGFLRSVGSVALFLPVITRIRRTTGIAKANLLMPLGFCAILGSTLTLVGSGSLILINSLLANLDGLRNAQGEIVAPMGIFFVFPIGIALLLVGILYFLLFSKWLLPNIPKKRTKAEDAMAYFERIYGVGGEFFEAKVLPSCPIKDNTLKQWETLLDPSVNVVGIKTLNTIHFPPLRKDEIRTGSIVLLLGPKQMIEEFTKKFELKIVPIHTFKDQINHLHAGLSEAVVPPSSPLVGRDFKELHMRKKFSAQVLAVLRGNKIYRGAELQSLNLRPGDALGMLSSWEALTDFSKSPDFVVVTTDYPHERYYTHKANLAIVFALLTISLLITTKISPALCLLLGAVMMIFTKVLSIDDAYEAVSWKTVFLLAGLLPLGTAVELSGTSDWITDHFLIWFGSLHVWLIQIILAISSALFSLVMSNVGATILLVPMAIDLADALQMDPRMFALIVAINSSNSFLLPTHQANALISGPGRYQVRDFFLVGAPLTILFLVISLLVLNYLF